MGASESDISDITLAAAWQLSQAGNRFHEITIPCFLLLYMPEIVHKYISIIQIKNHQCQPLLVALRKIFLSVEGS